MKKRICRKSPLCTAKYGCEHSDDCYRKDRTVVTAKKTRNYKGVPAGEHAKLYKSKRWQALRLRVLADMPICARCYSNGMIVSGTEIDHCIRHEGDLDLMFDYDNLQPLCRSCHGMKSIRERFYGDDFEVEKWDFRSALEEYRKTKKARD